MNRCTVSKETEPSFPTHRLMLAMYSQTFASFARKTKHKVKCCFCILPCMKCNCMFLTERSNGRAVCFRSIFLAREPQFVSENWFLGEPRPLLWAPRKMLRGSTAGALVESDRMYSPREAHAAFKRRRFRSPGGGCVARLRVLFFLLLFFLCAVFCAGMLRIVLVYLPGCFCGSSEVKPFCIDCGA